MSDNHQPDVFRNAGKDNHDRKGNGYYKGKGRAAFASKYITNCAKFHFQYTSLLPAACAFKVIGKLPKPPNRPMSVCKVTVTVNSSLSWSLPVFDHEMLGASPVFSVRTCARRVVSLPTRPAISASRQSSEA
ncbi:hypothetical protein DSY4657 [Desulfitobacterium hafniense Y51]|uniref:Uncharacterized protein n=1 Tax=Desulfitobacterium hafniense (strain Y51) TaxID=138119 RepID=Q24NE6_DESHY|nr:hypothetical protein DSY4657 [Desulfitobacterium hafniense Y51]